MNAVVVDTDVVSFVFKNHAIGRLYEPDLADRILTVSFMNVAELDRWTVQSRWGAERQRDLRRFLRRFALILYNRRLCTIWAQITVEARWRGRPIDCADAWIAATAVLKSVPLITHNYRDYQDVAGLSLISHGT